IRRTSPRCVGSSQPCRSVWARRPAPQARRIEIPRSFRKEHYMNLTTTFRRIVVISILAGMALAMPRPARAGRPGSDVIALFPKEIGEFAYADLKKARTLKWFPQLQEQMLPERFRQFEKFLASAGVDPNTPVDELAWGLVADSTSKGEGTGASSIPSGERVVGGALGSYSP